MDSTKLQNATVVLLESNSEMRRLVKSALLGIGFGFVHDCRTVDGTRSAAASTDAKPDVFVLDLDADKDAVCEMIEDIRHSRLGDNPFVIIIGMTHTPDEPVIQFVLDAGTDDLVAKPVSTKILSERIAYLTDNRKEFVATSGYLGPKRAKGVRPETEHAAQVKVPNSLNVKASGKPLTAIDEFEIKRAAFSFTLQRLYGMVLPIIDVAKKIENVDPEEAEGNDFKDEIVTLSALVIEIKAIELPETVRDLAHLTESLEKAVDQLAEFSSPSPRQFMIVRLHAQAIAATMRGDHDGSSDVVSAFGHMFSSADNDQSKPAAD